MALPVVLVAPPVLTEFEAVLEAPPADVPDVVVVPVVVLPEVVALVEVVVVTVALLLLTVPVVTAAVLVVLELAVLPVVLAVAVAELAEVFAVLVVVVPGWAGSLPESEQAAIGGANEAVQSHSESRWKLGKRMQVPGCVRETR